MQNAAVEEPGDRAVSEEEASVKTKTDGIARWSILLAVLFLGALLVQWRSGSFQTEFGHWPDVASHVTNSLLIRDFLDGHIGENPVKFAERYYIHYPKVSIGMWPPLYYLLAAEWMIVFGVNRVALLTLNALSAAFLSLVVGWFAAQSRGFWWGTAAAVLTMLIPQIVFGYALFMLDIPVAAMQLVALWCLLRYFETGRIRHGLLFGLAAAAAMFTKGNAMGLALLPPILILLTRSWWVLKKPGIYLAGAVVLLTAVPWQWFSLKIYRGTALVEPMGLQYFINRLIKLSGYIAFAWSGVGPALFLICLVGAASVAYTCWTTFWRKPTQTVPCESMSRALFEAGILSLMIATIVFHSIAPIPGPDERYLTTMYACLMVLAVEGVWCLGGVLAGFLGTSPPRAAIFVGAVIAVFFFVFTFSLARFPHMGFEDVCRLIRSSETDPRSGKIFVLSDADGEGAVVVETAFADTARPGRYVMRASKFLSDNTWSSRPDNPGSVYTPKLNHKDDVLKMLRDNGVEFVIVDRDRTVWPQDQQILLAALQSDAARWSIVFDGVPPAADRHLTVFRQDVSGIHSTLPLRVDVKHSIGKTLEDTPR